jgi:hypothetical protein
LYFTYVHNFDFTPMIRAVKDFGKRGAGEMWSAIIRENCLTEEFLCCQICGHAVAIKYVATLSFSSPSIYLENHSP